MKASTLIALSAAAAVSAIVLPQDQTVFLQDAPVAAAEDDGLYLVELSPGKTRWVTENEKWELRRVWNSILSYKLHI